jgi:hypothetical protein
MSPAAASGPAAQAFKALGISVKNNDGTLKSSSRCPQRSRRQVRKDTSDGATKSALAIAIFGKSGADMIPLLNQGGAAIKQAGEEAERFGIVLSKDVTDGAEQFNDNLTRMAKVGDGIIIKIAAGLLPTLVGMSNAMVDAAKNTDLLSQVSNILGKALQFVVGNIATTSLAIQRLAVEAMAAWEVLKAIGELKWVVTKQGLADLQAKWEEFRAVGAESDRQFKELQQTLTTAFDTDSAENFYHAPGARHRPDDEFARPHDGGMEQGAGPDHGVGQRDQDRARKVPRHQRESARPSCRPSCRPWG